MLFVLIIAILALVIMHIKGAGFNFRTVPNNRCINRYYYNANFYKNDGFIQLNNILAYGAYLLAYKNKFVLKPKKMHNF